MFENLSSRSRGLRAASAAALGLVLAVLGGMAIAPQDKYTVKVPGGLAFSEFKGYESWEVVSISRNDKLIAVILANPAMIEAYKAGIPANGKPFPDGAKMAKIHWIPKKNEYFPDTTVPGTLHDVDFMVKDSKGSRTAVDGDMPCSIRRRVGYVHARHHGRPAAAGRTTPSVGSRAIRS